MYIVQLSEVWSTAVRKRSTCTADVPGQYFSSLYWEEEDVVYRNMMPVVIDMNKCPFDMRQSFELVLQ